MLDKLDAFIEIVDFFIPFEVLSGIGLVFAAENIVEAWLMSGSIPMVWVYIYLVFITLIGVGRYFSADDDELDELSDDFDELTE